MPTVQHPAWPSVLQEVDNPDEWEAQGWKRLSDQADAAAAGEKPAGNATADAWYAYALTQPGVTEADLEGLNRDQLRDQFTE